MRLAWTTDLHLDTVDPNDEAYTRFLDDINAAEANAVLIGGDIANGTTIEAWLERLHADIEHPIYIVLGNHDFYHGDIRGIREVVRRVVHEHERLTWLREVQGYVPIGTRTGLVGIGGLGDARLGNAASPVLLNDFLHIRDLEGLSPSARNRRLGQLGREDADVLDAALARAASACTTIIVLLHVPPFAEACWHEGRHSDDDHLPFFASGALGDVLAAHAARRQDVDFLVLCGHTHSPGHTQLATNLQVLTGGAAYGHPEVTAVIEVQRSGVRVNAPGEDRAASPRRRT